MRLLPLLRSAALAVALLPALASAQTANGDWTMTPIRGGRGLTSRDTVQITIIHEPNWTSSFPISLTRFRDLSSDALRGDPAAARFRIESDAGIIVFTGHVGGGSGSGEFTFSTNRAFSDALRTRHVPGAASDDDLFRLAVSGSTLASVDRVLGALHRYDDAIPSASELARFSSHGISDATIEDLGEAGLRQMEPEEVVRLVNHGVDGRYVREWREAGYRDLDAEQLIRLRNHDVTSQWARQANERNGSRLDVDRLLRMRRGR
ncbi:MAG: hypothetical protein ABJE47_20970 [bacterium]